MGLPACPAHLTIRGVNRSPVDGLEPRGWGGGRVSYWTCTFDYGTWLQRDPSLASWVTGHCKAVAATDGL